MDRQPYNTDLTDAGKKIKGVKRHVLVDVLVLLIGIVVHSADIQDRDGAMLLLLHVHGRIPRVKLNWGMAVMRAVWSNGSKMRLLGRWK